MDLETLIEKLDIGESQDFECKRAEDNVPKDAWKTISAFANTEGGCVVLGVAEKKGKFQIIGVNNPEKQLKDFWDNHNNSQKLNIPNLVDKGWLDKSGRGRGTHYSLPNSDDTSLLSLLQNTSTSQLSSDRITANSDHLTESSDHLENLKMIAKPVRDKGKVPPDVMREVILKVCREKFLTLQQLEVILDRTNSTLRTRFLKKMVEEGLMELRYPDKLNHPEQAYRTKQ